MIEFDVQQAQLTPELLLARRAFPAAQAELQGPVLSIASSAAQVGWHGTEVSPESGSIAVVPPNGPLFELVGDIVMVRRRMATVQRSVFVYVIGTAPVVDEISLSRRAFFSLGLLANEYLTCSVEIVA